jgi:hypothetical protein
MISLAKVEVVSSLLAFLSLPASLRTDIISNS